MHQRSASLYENQIIFGQSGPYIMLNLIQCCCFMFVCWMEITFNHFRIEIIEKYSKTAYAFLIIGLFVYFIAQVIISSLALKWLTLVASVSYYIYNIIIG